MIGTNSQKDEDASWISGTIVWLQRGRDEIDSSGGTQADGSPMNSCELPDVAELHRADVEYLASSKSGEYCPISCCDGNVDDEVSCTLLHELGSPEQRVPLV